MQEWSDTLRSVFPIVVGVLIWPIQRGLYLWVERRWGPDVAQRTREMRQEIEGAEQIRDLEPRRLKSVVDAVEGVMQRRAKEDRSFQRRLALAFFILGAIVAVGIALAFR